MSVPDDFGVCYRLRENNAPRTCQGDCSADADYYLLSETHDAGEIPTGATGDTLSAYLCEDHAAEYYGLEDDRDEGGD
ncbi:hypothetical protein DMJ13_27420 [halophilic archaeon]|nr:hypothetical protein DMJ13_27420 [halophilic archaeon]